MCAQVTGKAFDQLLQLLVYLLMQKLGHSSMMVSGDALVTLKTICFHCGYRLVLSIAILQFCDLIPITSFLWSHSRGLIPMVSILWSHSHGLVLITLF